MKVEGSRLKDGREEEKKRRKRLPKAGRGGSRAALINKKRLKRWNSYAFLPIGNDIVSQ